MSHIAEVYAKDLGVKIGRPHITDHFFPGLPDKYITVQSSSKMPAARYKYWDIVLGLIKPHLNDIFILNSRINSKRLHQKINKFQFFKSSYSFILFSLI